MTTNFDIYIPQQLTEMDRVIIRLLIALGVECDAKARQDGSYNDYSGDLRSSIGYGVVVNGRIVKTGGFKQVKQGSKGVIAGKALVRELATNYPKGYVLIVVAGSNHTEQVEALDNKVVLTSVELFVKQRLPLMLQQLKLN